MTKLRTLDDLPRDLVARIRAIHPREPEKWVTKPIPALGGRTILETMSLGNGDTLIREFLARVEGHWGGASIDALQGPAKPRRPE
jgi:Trk K+ transport system NAD-binding subunit